MGSHFPGEWRRGGGGEEGRRPSHRRTEFWRNTRAEQQVDSLGASGAQGYGTGCRERLGEKGASPQLGTFTQFRSQAWHAKVRALTGPQPPISSLCSLEREQPGERKSLCTSLRAGIDSASGLQKSGSSVVKGNSPKVDQPRTPCVRNLLGRRGPDRRNRRWGSIVHRP